MNNGKVTSRKKRFCRRRVRVAGEYGRARRYLRPRWQELLLPGRTTSGDAGLEFYLQVSRSSYFASDSNSGRSQWSARRADFRLAGLSPGTYYWRLKATSESGQASDWSEPWKFGVVRRETSKTIDAAGWQVEAVGGNVYIISGKTQPGAPGQIAGKSGLRRLGRHVSTADIDAAVRGRRGI